MGLLLADMQRLRLLVDLAWWCLVMCFSKGSHPPCAIPMNQRCTLRDSCRKVLLRGTTLLVLGIQCHWALGIAEAVQLTQPNAQQNEDDSACMLFVKLDQYLICREARSSGYRGADTRPVDTRRW